PNLENSNIPISKLFEQCSSNPPATSRPSPLLYRTYTVHIRSTALTQQLPSLLLPQRLATITSLELFWELYSGRPGATGSASPGNDGRMAILHPTQRDVAGILKLYNTDWGDDKSDLAQRAKQFEVG
ncbi:MAG: hypothetical protein LQ341_005178, partial [Variospora aurantia]